MQQPFLKFLHRCLTQPFEGTQFGSKGVFLSSVIELYFLLLYLADSLLSLRPALVLFCFQVFFEARLICHRELRLRKAYVDHLETLALQRDVEKEVLQEKLMEQVSGTEP